MRRSKFGKIDYSELNSKPEVHELATAKYFSKMGFDVVFLRPSNIKGSNNPDFLLAGKVWETKSPIGKSRRTFEDDYRKAVKQSSNIIFDLRRKSQSEEKWCIEKLKNHSINSAIKTLVVITHDEKLLTLKGDFDIIKLR